MPEPEPAAEDPVVPEPEPAAEDPVVPEPEPAADDPVAYARRLQAEVEAAAAVRRRRQPALARLERDIERAWSGVAPPGAVGDQDELLLDRAERLAYVDVDVDVGTQRGISQIKRSIRKLVYWYLRYLADQLSVLHNVIVRMLRRLDERLDAVEQALHLSRGDELLDPAPDLGPEACRSVAGAMRHGPGPVAVVSCSEGGVVAALGELDIVAYGVDADPERIVGGSREGLDLRPGDPTRHLSDVGLGALGGLVLRGVVEEMAVPEIGRLIEAAAAALAPGGTIAVAVADPATRSTVEAELRAGRGLSPATWAHLLDRTGFSTRELRVDDDRVDVVVVAERP